MTGRRTDHERPDGEYPPEWVEQGARDGIDPVIWASSPGGAIYLAVWHEFPDASRFEHTLAAAPTTGDDWPPRPAEAVARVIALREARRQALVVRPDLSEDHWQRIVGQVWLQLTVVQRSNPREILATLEALGMTTRTASVEARGLTERQIRQVAHAVRRSTDRAPSRVAVAGVLGTSEATLKRAMKDLGMNGWPPAPPEE